MSGQSGKPAAILRLVRLFEGEDDPTVREWCREAVWREVRDILGWEPPIFEQPRLPYKERVRLFVIAGYRTCPCCGRRMEPAAAREAS
jgi:hypothetical protein